MPQRHSRDLRRIRMDVGGDRGHARPRPHVRHRQPADRPCRNRQNGQINQRRPHIHPIPRTQRKKILGKWPMVAIDLLRKRRTHQRGHRQTIHTNPKGTSLDQTAIPPRPQETGNPRPTNLEHSHLNVGFPSEENSAILGKSTHEQFSGGNHWKTKKQQIRLTSSSFIHSNGWTMNWQ